MKHIQIAYLQALNPTAKKSGIRGCPDGHARQDWIQDTTCTGMEIIDETVCESISAAYHSNLGFFSGVKATFDVIVGNHYVALKPEDSDEDDDDDSYTKKNSKGVLDYLLFPLVARVIMYDFERKKAISDRGSLIDIIAAPIAFAAEVTRLSAGLALTLLALPIIALVHIIKALGCVVNTPTEHTSYHPIPQGRGY